MIHFVFKYKTTNWLDSFFFFCWMINPKNVRSCKRSNERCFWFLCQSPQSAEMQFGLIRLWHEHRMKVRTSSMNHISYTKSGFYFISFSLSNCHVSFNLNLRNSFIFAFRLFCTSQHMQNIYTFCVYLSVWCMILPSIKYIIFHVYL